MSLLRYTFCASIVLITGCSTTNNSNFVPGKTHAIDTRPHANVWERIRSGYGMDNLADDRVTYWINYYSARPNVVTNMAQRSSKYIYYVTTELEKRGMPTELALLPFVESAYKTSALSRSKAAGLWQFIPATGTEYNLPQTWWRDVRRDPISSTQAAINYFTYLYTAQDNDWHLALASYNWGVGAVKRARDRNRENGLKTDYLSLKMPEETRNYVPKLLALKIIITNPRKYGVSLPNIPDKPYLAEVPKNVDIDVAVAARLAGMSLAEFKELNPAFNRPVILAAHSERIILPKTKVSEYMRNLKSYKGQLASWQGYTPTSGESLLSIAQRHGISLERLKSLNGYGRKQNLAISSRTLLLPRTSLGLDADSSSSGLKPLPAATDKDVIPIQVVPPRALVANTQPVSHMTTPTVYEQKAVRQQTNAYANIMPTPDPLAELVASNEVRNASNLAHPVHNIPAPVTSPQPAVTPALASAPSLTAFPVISPEAAMTSATRPTRVLASNVPTTYAKSPVAKAYAANYQVPAVAAATRPVAYPIPKAEPRSKSAAPATTHHVAQGETLYSLAKRYNTTVADLSALNNLGGGGLQAGMVLRLPGTHLKG